MGTDVKDIKETMQSIAHGAVLGGCVGLMYGLPLVALGAMLALAIVTGALKILGLWG